MGIQNLLLCKSLFNIYIINFLFYFQKFLCLKHNYKKRTQSDVFYGRRRITHKANFTEKKILKPFVTAECKRKSCSTDNIPLFYHFFSILTDNLSCLCYPT